MLLLCEMWTRKPHFIAFIIDLAR